VTVAEEFSRSGDILQVDSAGADAREDDDTPMFEEEENLHRTQILLS
jgi:hypothetical protein